VATRVGALHPPKLLIRGTYCRAGYPGGMERHETLGLLPVLGLAILGPQGKIFNWGHTLGREG